MTNASPSVRTRLAHRKHIGPNSWWHDAVICTVDQLLSAQQTRALSRHLIAVLRLGFTAISIRVNPAVSIPEQKRAVEELVTAAHRVGMKVIVALPIAQITSKDSSTAENRISTADAKVEHLLHPIRQMLEAGVDGVDLGIVDSVLYGTITEISGLILAEMTEYGSTILTAEISTSDAQVSHEVMAETWFHHLRDASLKDAPWNADEFQRCILEALNARDHLGQVAAWDWSPRKEKAESSLTRIVTASTSELGTASGAELKTRTQDFSVPKRSVPDSSWHSDPTLKRRGAVGLFAASLPGAFHTSWNDIGGDDLISIEGVDHSDWSTDETLAHRHHLIRHCLRIRSERRIGVGSLAVIDGLAWSHPGVSVHMSSGVMVVFNTSNTPVYVPAEHSFLLSSSEVSRNTDGDCAVPPDSCAWFDTARVKITTTAIDPFAE